MKLFPKILTAFSRIFVKSYILYVRADSEYTSAHNYKIISITEVSVTWSCQNLSAVFEKGIVTQTCLLIMLEVLKLPLTKALHC